MEFLSLEAIRLMGLDIGGVDLLFNNNGYKIIAEQIKNKIGN